MTTDGSERSDDEMERGNIDESEREEGPSVCKKCG